MSTDAVVIETRATRGARKKLIKKQMLKVLSLSLLLLLLLLYLLVANLPSVLPVSGLRFLFSVYRLNEPMGVSVDAAGDFYVSEPINNRILKFNANGDLIKKIGAAKGAGKVYGVYGSAIDAKRKEVFFADFISRSIQVYNTDGKFLRRFPKNAFINAFGKKGLVPLDVDLYKDKAFVTTRNGIVVFDRKGTLKETWGVERGKKFGEFDFPNGIAIDQKTGRIFVADTLNRRVTALNQKGEVLWTVGKPDNDGKLASFFSLPRNIAVDSLGSVYVTDTFEHHVVVLSADGALKSIIGSRGVEDGKFNFPEGIAITGGRLVVADKGNARAQIFSIGSSLTEPKKGELARFKEYLVKSDSGKSIGKTRRIKYIKDKPAYGEKL